MPKFGTSKKEKVIHFFDTFAGLKADDGWTITYSPKSKRASLKQNDNLIMASVSLDDLKRVAEKRHDVGQDKSSKGASKPMGRAC